MSNDGIVTLDVKHIDEENVAYSFYSSLKLSNYKVVICYNLVFNFKVFCQNYGSIISAVFLALYVGSLIYYCIRTIQPLKVEISRLLFESGEMNNIIPMDIKKISPQENATKKSNLKNKSKKANSDKSVPPKKNTTQPRRVNKKAPTITEGHQLKSSNKKKMHFDQRSNDIMISGKISSQKLLNKQQEKSGLALISSKKLEVKDKKEKKVVIKDKDSKSKTDEEIIDETLLDNYELNHFKYELACQYDHRTCCRTYYSVLMREELVLFTFFSCNDYNLFYVKIARFLILATTSMAFNALFFFHKTMYKKQDIEENWSFWQKLPQLLFVLIGNHIIEVYLCWLSMTDSVIYKIKELSRKHNDNNNNNIIINKNVDDKKNIDNKNKNIDNKRSIQNKKNIDNKKNVDNNKNNDSKNNIDNNIDTSKKVIDIIDCMKCKLVAFFISTFILFLLFWYFISAFCAVYKNTQGIFIRDSAISFVTSLIDPFLIFGLTTILRKISLAPCCRKRAKCVYRISDFFPIF